MRRKLATVLALLFCALGATHTAFAQAPPPVPALPDTERRTAFTITSQTGPFGVGYALYGTGTDFGAWIEVWLNGVRLTPVTDFTVTLASGTLATAARPMTNAQVTLTVASTGTLQIVGAERPRRISQFAENRGVAARDLNVAITDLVAQNRETWDRTNDANGRAILAPPGEVLQVMPPAASRAGKYLTFDGTGSIPQFTTVAPGTAGVSFPSTTVVGDIAVFNNTAGTAITNRAVDYINVKNPPYSAACDGVTDDTTKIQSAATAAAGGKVALYFPTICLISSAIDISGVPRVFCSGQGLPANPAGGLLSNNATANILSKNSILPALIENCAIRSSVTRSGGGSIFLTGNAQGDTVRNNFISDAFRGIWCDGCVAGLFDHNQIISYINHGIHVLNTAGADAGDSNVTNNLFNTGAGGTTVAVYILSSGGWNITKNKFLPSTYGIWLDRDNLSATSILNIEGNSIDSQTGAGVILQGLGTGTYANISVANNIFSAQVNCVQVLGANANLSNISINGGVCNYSNRGLDLQAAAFVNAFGITFNATAGGNPTAIVTAATWPSSGAIGRNFYNNTNSHYTFTNSGIDTIAAGPPKTTTPALTSCGTTPGIVGDDRGGFVQMGGGAPTGCVITFAVAYPVAPRCTVIWRATPLASQSYTYSVSAITLTQTGTTNNFVDYRCDPAN